MSDNPFKKATKKQALLRMAITGPSGGGKTYTALTIGAALIPGAKVAVIDTERGSASKYADLFRFDVLELTSFAPDNYMRAIRAAQDNGYNVLIIDSLSHAWFAPGGVLNIVDEEAKRNQSGNKFVAWSKGSDVQNRLVDAILSSQMHVIATMRSKMEYVLETNEKGKQVPRKVGLAPIQRDGVEYEFDVVALMDITNTMIVDKSRCPALTNAVIERPGADVAATLRAWLSDGESVPEPTPTEPRNVDQHGEVTRDEPAPIVPPIKTDADRAADRAARRLNPAPAGNGRADVSTHNPPVESMADELPPAVAEQVAAWWTDADKWNALVKKALDLPKWQGIALSRARNRVAKALNVPGGWDARLEWTGMDAKAALALVEAYVPSDERESEPASPTEQAPLMEVPAGPVSESDVPKRKRAS